MDLNSARQVSSCGPEDTAAYWKNAVKQDELWKDLVSKERKQALQWEKTWGLFLKSDKLQGGPRDEKPLPIVSVFSDFFPNTSNQMYGTRQFTHLGREMVRRERLILWPGSNRRRKIG